MKPSRPPRQVCPLCGLDEFVRLESTGPDLWDFRCDDGPRHPGSTYTWSPTPAASGVSGRTGLGDELGVYDDLTRCVLPGERVEYGIVEHRFADIARHSYGDLLRRYGHTSLGPTKYSTASFLSHALSQLCREGILERIEVPATGYWTYLRIVPAYARAGTGPDVTTTSWVTFAAGEGIDPDTWPSTASFAR